MLHELRFYEIAAGRLGDYLDHAEKIALPFRGDRFGKLLGFWSCEIGAVNCVYNLWEHESVETRETLRAQLQKDDAWRREYLSRSEPLMRRQVSRLVKPVGSVRPPAAPGNLFEIRFFRTRPGKTQAFASYLQNGLPAALSAAAIASWTGNSGDVNEVVHLSAFPRSQAIDDILPSTAWRAVFEAQGTRLENVRSSLMIPAPFSPWR